VRVRVLSHSHIMSANRDKIRGADGARVEAVSVAGLDIIALNV